MDETIAAPLLPSDDRRQAIEQLIGFAKTDAPPDDAAVDQILLEERLKKLNSSNDGPYERTTMSRLGESRLP